MSRLTQRGATGPLNPWTNLASGTAEQAFSANPGNQIQPTTGTGIYDPNFVTYVGQKFDTSDGREMVIVQNGTSAIAAGTLLQSAAEVTAFEKLAMTVPTATPATAGTYQILVTNGSTVLNVNQYAGGYAIIAAGTGIGQMLKISTHQPAANAATFLVTLEDPIQTTLDATSKVTLLLNPYQSVITTPTTTATGGPVGVALYGIAASTAPTYSGTTGALTANGVNQYGLITCHGPAAVLVDSTITNVGYPVGVSKTTAGTVGVATLTTVPQIGVSMQTLTSSESWLVGVIEELINPSRLGKAVTAWKGEKYE